MFSSEFVERSHEVVFVRGLFDSRLHVVLFGYREDVFTCLFIQLRDDVWGSFARRRHDDRVSTAYARFAETHFESSFAFRSREIADENSHGFSISTA